MSRCNQYFSNLYDLLVCITKAVDLVSPEVPNHHWQVAYLSDHIADTLRLPVEQKRTLVIAALLHDVGAIITSLDNFVFLEEEDPAINYHAFLGANLLSDFSLLSDAATVIRYHHIPWHNGQGNSHRGEAIPLLSHIIHLVDKIAVRVNRNECVISQINLIKAEIISKRNSTFVPDIVDAFSEICDQEALWLDFVHKPEVPADLSLEAIKLALDEVVELTQIFSRIIDFRSTFTAMHSAGVAASAVKLAELNGMSEAECKMMRIAANLHDIGKLAVPKKILEKQDKLEPLEYDIIRSHSFYTYRLLKPISGFEDITQWAAYHHEKLNGRGYPFHFKANNLPLGSRIMAVADIFTAITEDRPYRKGMSKEQAIATLKGMVESGAISPSICSLLVDNYESVACMRRESAERAVENYHELHAPKYISACASSN